MPPSLLGMDSADLSKLLPNQPPYRAAQLYHALYRQQIQSFDQLTTFPPDLRRTLARDATLGWPQIAGEFTSADGTRRYLLRLADGKTVETVFMPEPRRDTICISSQVGCPVDCRFCLTALMGLERNLTAGEIVGQVLVVSRLRRLDPRSHQLNIVMMGQGEPLLNLPAVIKATRILCAPDGLGLSERRVTVSTSGIIPKFAELALEPVRPKLAVSLNASTEEQRRQIMPITRKWPLKDLLAACRAYPLRSWEKLTFEYVLLAGVNDSDADARRVAGLIGALRCKLNLIALNPGPGIPFETPSTARVDAFRRIVSRVVPCFIRKPRGRDIYAACGQLKLMSAGDPAG